MGSSSGSLRKVLVFVSSPGDVQPERLAVDTVIAELNRGVADANGVFLRALRWERDTIPAAMPSQEAVNTQLPDYQVYVGILWKRFGTPTPVANSGTEEEFRDAWRSYKSRGTPWIMLYFCERPFYSKQKDDYDQFARVVDFRQEVGSGVLHSYTFVETGQFEAALREHLTKLITDHLAVAPAPAPPPAAPAGWDTRVLATTELEPVGRDDDIARIVVALKKKTSFVVTGIGGIGKSTVLDAAIRALADPGYTHLANHRITEEGGTDDRLRHLLSKLVIFLGAEVESSEPRDLFGQVRALLHGKSVLFALDNADDEHSQRTVRTVREELPTLTLAVTSTQRRWEGLVTIELDAMATDQAARLYRRIRGGDDDEAAIRTLVDALQRHPMVIMQVAVEARERGASAAAMLGPELRPGRGLTTRFDAARARLAPAGQRALAVIGQLAKVNVRVDLIKQVAGATDDDLLRLENQCLARLDSIPGHLSVHRLVHAWCRDQAGDERVGYLTAIAAFYSFFLTSRRQLRDADLVELDEEWENILKILDSDADPAALARLADCTIDDHFDEPEGYVFRRRKTSFLMERSDRIEAAARQVGGDVAARLEKNLGHIFYLHGKTVKAQSLFVRARQRYNALNDQVGVTATMWLLGYIADDENRYRDAEQLYREGTERARNSGNPDADLLAVGHHLIGSTLYHQGDLKGAERQFRIARQHLGPASRPSVRSRVLRRLGAVLVQANRPDEARLLLAEALRLAHTYEHNRDIARTTRQIGRLHLATGALAKAERQLRWSYQRFQQLRSRREYGGVLRDTAELRRRQHRLPEARAHVEESVKIAQEFNSLFGEAAGNEQLAAIARDEGRPDAEIVRKLHRAANIYTLIGYARARQLLDILRPSGALEPALPRPLQGVMFDLMDTLAYIPPETYDSHRRAMAAAFGVELVDFNAAWDETRTQASAGMLESTLERLRAVARILSVNADAAVVEEAARSEDAVWREVRLYPDAESLMSALAGRGMRVAIVTNGPIALAMLNEQLGLSQFLYRGGFFLSSEVGEVKPDRTLYDRALAHLEADPAHCVFVGDGDDRELDGAMALGIHAIRLNHPGRRPVYVNIKKASRDWDLEVDSLAKLAAILTDGGV